MESHDAARSRFLLDPAVAYLNHGAFGAVPAAVLDAQAVWQRRIEANPTRFMREDLPSLLRARAARAAARFGGRGEDWVFVGNTTEGVNAVAQSLVLAPGDRVVTTEQVYNAVRQTLRHHCARSGASYLEVALPPPLDDPAQVVAAIAAAQDDRTRLVVLDHITSATATVMPVAEVAALCRARGVPILIDGAHAPGQIGLDVPALSVDWYVGNAHKWLFSARGTALLWCAPARQDALHPTVLSHGYGQGYVAEFDWTGTRDASTWLTLDAGMDCHDALGGPALIARNHAANLDWADRLARSWRATPSVPAAMRAAMTSLRLPAPFRGDAAAALALRHRLSSEFRIETPVWSMAGALWLRISAQAYVDPTDIDRLDAAIRQLAG
jgi:isopenicillin-N epimerase